MSIIENLELEIARLKNQNHALLTENYYLEIKQSNYYKKGLRKAIEIIESEVKFARQVNPVIVSGMYQIKHLVEKELESD